MYFEHLPTTPLIDAESLEGTLLAQQLSIVHMLSSRGNTSLSGNPPNSDLMQILIGDCSMPTGHLVRAVAPLMLKRSWAVRPNEDEEERSVWYDAPESLDS